MDAPVSRLAEPVVMHGTQTEAPSARYTRD